jgi:glycine cleavage system H protein
MTSEDRYPADLHYHPEHDWVRLDGDEAVFGITWHAQDALGEIVYVDLPEVGSRVEGGASYGELESVKAVSDVIAPLAGVVTAINAALTDDPGLLNQAPYAGGWLVRVRLDDAGSIAGLLDRDAYVATLD